MKLQQYKNIATRIKAELDNSSEKLSHTKIMEIMAKAMGFHNYNGCKATLENPEAEKPYQEFFFTFHTDKENFDNIWNMRNKDAINPKYMSIEIHYGTKQIVHIVFDGDPEFIKEHMKTVSNYCVSKNIRLTLTKRFCEQTDFSYDNWLTKKVEESLNGPKISAEKAKEILGFDVEDFRPSKLERLLIEGENSGEAKPRISKI